MADTSGQFTLRLLGAFRLRAPDGERIEIASKKGAALIAMLAMAGEGERTRGWLQEKLWGSRQHAQARSSLRRELSDLRRLLNAGAEPLLLTEHDRVRLDLRQLNVDARAAVLPEGANSEMIGALSYDFLEGLDIAGEEGFEEWLREQRTALKARALAEGRTRPNGDTHRGAEPALAPSFVSEADESFNPAPGEIRTAGERPTVAVLRFEHPTRTEEEVYLAEGITEEIISGLAKSRMLSVTSRHSSMTFDPKGLDTRGVCARLGVDYLVQGHVRRLGAAIRVSVALVNGAEDKTIWSARYDGPVDDLFAVQDQITTSIIGTLEPALLDHEELQSFQSATRNPRHWNLFMRGRWHFWRATLDDWAKARDFLTRALALEPDDVPTLSMLALCNLGEVWAGVATDSRAAVAEAHRLSLRAVSLDAADASAHNVLGTALSLMGRIDQALAEQRRALELNPYLAAAAGELGRLAVFAGRFDEAIAYSDRAIAASPNDPHAFVWFRNKALARFILGEYTEAARHAADACTRSPHQFFLHYLLGACYAAAGDQARALAAVEEGRRLHPHYTIDMMRVAYPFARAEYFDHYVEALRRAGWDDA
jgi:TolB-like protein/Tfp pilus assembly protein PilF